VQPSRNSRITEVQAGSNDGMDRLGRSGRAQSNYHHLTELAELVRSDIAHDPKIETGFRPMPNIVTLDRLDPGAGVRCAQSLRDEQIDNVFAAMSSEGIDFILKIEFLAHL
jgi:hypothetical protein